MMGILDGFIGFSELVPSGIGKARLNVWGGDAGTIRKYLRRHGVKATCHDCDEGAYIYIAKKDKARAVILLEKRRQ